MTHRTPRRAAAARHSLFFPPARTGAPAILLALGLALMAGLVFGTGATAQGSGVIVHYQKNMAFNNKTERRLARDILASGADTVSMQEVNKNNRRILGMLEGAYPSQHWCWFDEIGGVAVLSRWPVVEGTKECMRERGVTRMQVKMPQGRVWVLSVHMETPDKPLHAAMREALVPRLRAMRGPVIMGGDFNSAPGSFTVQTLAAAAGVKQIGKTISTYELGGVFGFPLDYVLATGGVGSTERRPFLGSDHYGLLSRFTMAN